MRPLALLYYLFSRRRNTRDRFERLYQLDRDPFRTACSEYEQKKLADLVQLLGTRRFRNAVDIGCGPGTIARELALRATHVVAVDFSRLAVREARKRCAGMKNIDFLTQDIRKLKIDQRFDLVVCSEILYYLDAVELSNFTEWLRGHVHPRALIAVVGKAKDPIVLPALETRFRLVERVEQRAGVWRPYAISLFQADVSVRVPLAVT